MGKSKFDFKAAASSLLYRMGANLPALGEDRLPFGYAFSFDTQAGRLLVTVYDDWVAAMFENPKAAAELVGDDARLNKNSGKWNWHFTDPTADSLVELARGFAGVVVSDEEIEDLVDDSFLDEGEGDATLFRYGYRDADNYKTNSKVVLAGGFTRLDVKVLFACADREGDAYFIPGQVGLADLQDNFSGCESMWLDERDHPYHEIHAIEQCDEEPAKDAMTMSDLVARFVAVAAEGGWDDNYKPAMYETMVARAQAQSGVRA